MNHNGIKLFVSIAALALSALAAGPVHAGPYSGLFVFGDSYSDPGNVAAATPFRSPLPTGNDFIPDGPYTATGTFSNGQVWASDFAAMLGLSAQPALLGGTNFAFGGARTGGPDVPVPTLLSQAAMFLGATGNQVPSSALYVVAALGNDARDTLDRLAHGNNTVAADALSYATNMATIVNELRGAGAQHILVMNTGDLGLVPYVRLADQFAPGTAAVASLVASIYDQTLAAVLGQASDLAIFDTFDFIDDTVASGAFANVTDACGAQSGADCSQYLFWDGIHVTAAGHQALANAVFAQVVAEPASVTLVAFALFGAALAGRRRVRQPG